MPDKSTRTKVSLPGALSITKWLLILALSGLFIAYVIGVGLLLLLLAAAVMAALLMLFWGGVIVKRQLAENNRRMKRHHGTAEKRGKRG